jgi:hypothetical protein
MPDTTVRPAEVALGESWTKATPKVWQRLWARGFVTVWHGGRWEIMTSAGNVLRDGEELSAVAAMEAADLALAGVLASSEARQHG